MTLPFVYMNALIAYAIGFNVAVYAAAVTLVTPPKREEKQK